ncbi:MAG: hypothetical protein AAGF74_02105 [Pseudomonadota bacterium]
MLETLFSSLGLGWKAAFFGVEVFQAAGATEELRRQTLVMLVVAGISRAIGTVAILALNQVHGKRYPLVFFVEGLVFAFAALAHALAAVAADWLFFENRVPDAQLFWIVALAHGPYLLGFLVLMPYFGEGIDRLLRLWSTLLIFFALHWAFGMPAHVAVLVAVAGWLTYAVISAVIGRPFRGLAAAARRLAAGGPA